MAKNTVLDWDPVAANNTDVGGIPIDGAVTTPSQVDNIEREQMAQIRAGITAGYFIPAVMTLPKIWDTSADHKYSFGVSELVADRTITLPLLTGNDTFVFQAHTQTLTNKTLTSPTINTPTIATPTVTGFDASTTAKGISEFATATEYRTGTDTGRSLVVSEVWASGAEVALTDAATIAVDMSTFINATVALGGNRTLGQPTNLKPGQSGVIRIRQDATGNRTLAYHADWLFAGGVDPVLSTGAFDADLLFYHVCVSGFVYATLVKKVS